jgi:hypothetical protein
MWVARRKTQVEKEKYLLPAEWFELWKKAE